MKLAIYYLLILLLIPSLYWAGHAATTPFIFCLAMLAYALVYRPIRDGLRLIELGSHEKMENVLSFRHIIK